MIPGLIDAHVHLLIAPEIVDERSLRNYERTALRTVMSGFLSHGITTVRSTGDPLPYIVQLRERMEQTVTGPRVVVTGPVASSPGGHPATTVDLLQDFSALQKTVAVLKGGRLAHGALPTR